MSNKYTFTVTVVQYFIFHVINYFLFVGGLGEAVCSAVACCRDITVKKLAVQEVPRSGKSAELLEKYGISANCIVKAVNQILSQ